MNPNYDILFTPTKVGSVEIKNRFVMCAMEGTAPIEWLKGKGYSEEVYDLLVDRAKDGVGLIIPGTIPLLSIVQNKWLYKNPKAFHGVDKLTSEIHRHGSKIFFQFTCGFGRNFTLNKTFVKFRKLMKPVLDLETACASPDAGLPNVWMPEEKTRAITKAEIQEFIHAFAEAAFICKEHGVDGVEVHAVHEGYLLDQFTTSYTNHRTDEYGGSLENRYRFPCEIVKAIKARCGDDYPVMLRYSVTSKVKDFNHGIVPGEDNSAEIGRTMEESKQAIKLLRQAGYDAFNCDNGTYDSWYWAHPPVYMPLNCNLQETEDIRGCTDAAIGVAGRMQLDKAAQAVKNGSIDFVGIARQFLTDEKYLRKIQSDDLEDVRPCISCHTGCLPIGVYKGSGGAVLPNGPTGICALYPYTRHEKKYAAAPAKRPKKVVVIGGGVAGMECVLQMSARGHTVTLYEKSNRLGGVFASAAAPSFKEKDKELLDWYRRQIEKSPVALHMNTEITNLSTLDADEIIVATGALATRQLKVPGGERCVTAVDYLLGKAQIGEKVAVVGGGLTGCEIAYELVLAGKQPFIVEMLDDIMKVPGISAANSNCLRDLLDYHKVPIYLEAKTIEVKESAILVEANGKTVELPADTVITSIGYTAGTPFEKIRGKHVHVIGDADKVANLRNAVWAANDLAVKLSK